jgi:superfamily I DNA and/or RNA helicase
MFPNTQGYNPKDITFLIRNYRSHKNILELPSRLFYDNELQAHADQLLSNELCNWKNLSNSEFTFLFCGIIGKDQREKNSPSWFNVQEINKLVTYVESLFDQYTSMKATDIGIIAPYRKQVEKIKMLIGRKDRLKGIKVGSVEEFQGQEFKVIILSTVRSEEEYLITDAKYKLGFVSNYRRLNVAITRAKSLLVIVGNPHVLSTDPHWLELLRYCTANKSFVGDGKDYETTKRKETLKQVIEQLDGQINESPFSRDI